MVTLEDSPSVLATVDCFDFGDLFWLFLRVTLVHSPSLLGPVDCFWHPTPGAFYFHLHAAARRRCSSLVVVKVRVFAR